MDKKIVKKMLNLAAAIQQVPAPTFQEWQRGREILARFQAEDLHEASMDALGNVYACLPGAGTLPPVVVSAHLDTVFSQEMHLVQEWSGSRIYGPGIGDNSTGVAALFGLLWVLKAGEVALPGDLWLVANVGEEGLGNLRGMQAVVDRFGSTPRAYVILEGMAYGQIYHRALGSQRYRIIVETGGGHSWVDFGKPSAVHELARLIHLLTQIPLPGAPRTTLNVGKIYGGLSVNTIAAEAALELDTRSEDAQALSQVVAQVEKACKTVQRRGVKVTMDLIGSRPGGELDHSHPLVQLASRCLQGQGLQPHLNIGSTDANIPLSRGYPAVCIGITTGAGAHTLGEYINTAPAPGGLSQLVNLVQGIYTLE
jgi:tripeptide aminopeptidase